MSPWDPDQDYSDAISAFAGLNLGVESMTDEGGFVIPLKVFDEHMSSLRMHYQNKDSLSTFNNLVASSNFYLGIRLVQLFFDTNPNSFFDVFLGSNNLNKVETLSKAERTYFVTFEDASQNYAQFGLAIPIVSYEKPLTLDTCESAFVGSLYRPGSEDFAFMMRQMEIELSQTQEYKDFMDTFFPIRRFMAIATVHSTSAIAGFNDLPGLFDNVKSLASFIAMTAMTPESDRLGDGTLMTGIIDQVDFQKKLGDEFPGDPNDPKCFEFPNLTKDFWDNFFKELANLAKYFPSILFRGLANNLDPAYKEMRAHYLNCDINQLNWRGLGVSSPPTRLINGLNLAGGDHRTRSGKYNSILSQLPIDLFKSLLPFPSPFLLSCTVSKTISYAFTGFLPFIDLSMYFKIPCLDRDINWLTNAKYDFGARGRYGHPVSPLTAFALSTLQLPADINKRNVNCEPAESILSTENECEDIEE
tara:strand:+ start:127 stop:1545 length:1419 start_codon:yes stop_codon:yes gene_type:complete